MMPGGDRVKEWDTLGLYQSITEGAPSLMSVILCYSTHDDSTDPLVQCGGHNLVELNIHSHPFPFVLDSVLLFPLLNEFHLYALSIYFHYFVLLHILQFFSVICYWASLWALLCFLLLCIPSDFVSNG